MVGAHPETNAHLLDEVLAAIGTGRNASELTFTHDYEVDETVSDSDGEGSVIRP